MKDQNNVPAKIETVQRKENFNFQYVFSEEELRSKSKQLAKTVADLASIEDELKSLKADFKAKTEARQAEVNLLSQHINNGHEWVLKTCLVQYDFDKGRKYYFYEGLQVGDEKMTNADYQLKADLPEYKDGDGTNPWENFSKTDEHQD